MSNSKVRKQLEAIEAKTKKYSEYTKIEKEYAECKKYADIFDKIDISEEDMKKITNQ